MAVIYIKGICGFLITLALIAGMVGCGEVAPPTRYNLTMAVAPGDSGTATDLNNASPYTAGTGVNIRAVAAAGYRFVNWAVPAGTFANANAAETTFIMPAQNVTVTANFGIEIYDWYDLDAIRENLGGRYILMNDLYSTTPGYEKLASETANQGKGWQPIGAQNKSFTGSFDGQGYEIRDLFINYPDEDFVALFSVVDKSGFLKNIGVVNSTVNSHYEVTASLVGLLWGNVSNSYSATYVASCGDVGGLVGLNQGTVSNSYSTGNVTGDYNVGGLVGLNEGTVSNSYSSGNVTSVESVGGLVGASNGTVSNSYSTGNVTGDVNVGGLVGRNDGTVNNSFWDTETSGQNSSAGGTGKTTAEMQDIATFLGATWNITAVGGPGERNIAYVWNIVDDVTYAFLSWQPAV